MFRKLTGVGQSEVGKTDSEGTRMGWDKMGWWVGLGCSGTVRMW